MVDIIVYIAKSSNSCFRACCYIDIPFCCSEKFKNLVFILKAALVIGSSNGYKLSYLLFYLLPQSVVKIINFSGWSTVKHNFFWQIQMIIGDLSYLLIIITGHIPENIILIFFIIIRSVGKAFGVVAFVLYFKEPVSVIVSIYQVINRYLIGSTVQISCSTH